MWILINLQAAGKHDGKLDSSRGEGVMERWVSAMLSVKRLSDGQESWVIKRGRLSGRRSRRRRCGRRYQLFARPPRASSAFRPYTCLSHLFFFK